MANPQGSDTSLTSKKREFLTCGICRHIFRDPKLLPCSHTFCQKCLQDLIHNRQPKTTFPCPTCHEDIQVPAEGVSAFQTNFYLDTEELERARNENPCSVHADKQEDMFCVDCNLLICVLCKQAGHLHHRSQSLQDAKAVAEQQLLKDRAELKQLKVEIEKKGSWKTNHKEFEKKMSIIERKIQDRHAKIAAAADEYLTNALKTLQDDSSNSEKLLNEQLEIGQKNLEKLNALEKKIDTAVDSGNRCQLVNTATEMRQVFGNEELMREMEMKAPQEISRLVYQADSPQHVLERMKNFIGTAQQISYRYTQPEVSVREVAQSGTHTDSRIFSLSPRDDHMYLRVSFQPSFKDKAPYVKCVSREGVVSIFQNNQGSIKGTYSFSFRGTGNSLGVLFSIGETVTKRRVSETHCVLRTNRKEYGGHVFSVKVVTFEPFKTEYTPLFRISCGPHHAVDVNGSEKLMTVLEEGAEDDSSRKVKLFQWRGQKDALHTYHSPLSPCRLADVCFYTLGGQEVLLISDELNDAIHVVEIQGTHLIFSRFLAAGSSLLVQPTALNTDREGRLWVGCRGGRILVMEPLNDTVGPQKHRELVLDF